MKKVLIFFIFLILFCANNSFASTEEERLRAAIQYEELVSVEGLINDMLQEMDNNPQIQISDKDIEVMRDSYDYEEIRQQYLKMLVKHFTLEEIKALNNFYSTPEGRSVMKKMPLYMSDFMPYIQKMTIEVLQKVMTERSKNN